MVLLEYPLVSCPTSTVTAGLELLHARGPAVLRRNPSTSSQRPRFACRERDVNRSFPLLGVVGYCHDVGERPDAGHVRADDWPTRCKVFVQLEWIDTVDPQIVSQSIAQDVHVERTDVSGTRSCGWGGRTWTFGSACASAIALPAWPSRLRTSPMSTNCQRRCRRASVVIKSKSTLRLSAPVYPTRGRGSPKIRGCRSATVCRRHERLHSLRRSR